MVSSPLSVQVRREGAVIECGAWLPGSVGLHRQEVRSLLMSEEMLRVGDPQVTSLPGDGAQQKLVVRTFEREMHAHKVCWQLDLGLPASRTV